MVDPDRGGWLLDDDAGRILSSLVLCRLLRLLTATWRRTDLGRRQRVLDLLHRLEMLTQSWKGLLGKLLELLIVPVLRVLIEQTHGIPVGCYLHLNVVAVEAWPRRALEGLHHPLVRLIQAGRDCCSLNSLRG